MTSETFSSSQSKPMLFPSSLHRLFSFVSMKQLPASCGVKSDGMLTFTRVAGMSHSRHGEEG